MNFKTFRDLFAKHAEAVMARPHLFRVNMEPDAVWEGYLNAFPNGSDPIFRVRRGHDCGCCRHAIKNVGNIIAIEDGKMITMWDFETGDPTYQTVVDQMAQNIHLRGVTEVFKTTVNCFGADHTIETSGNGELLTWDHFHVKVPKHHIHSGRESVESYLGSARDTRHVFQRALEELTEDSIQTVLELIGSNSLYKGEEWSGVLRKFLAHKQAYSSIMTDHKKDLYAWEHSVLVGGSLAKIRNSSIGTLLIDIREGVDLDEAVRKYEEVVAPANYKRPKAIYSQRMLDDAKKTLEQEGLLGSLGRRFARLDDITVNNILFSNRDAAGRIGGASDVFAQMGKNVATQPKQFSRVEEITAEKFVSEVLPTCQEIEAYVKNEHAGNFVSLIAPKDPAAPTMFKWGNAFSWAYAGNVTDSMKERVKAAGGKVDGVLRFSIQWNDDGTHDENDLDAHCQEPNGCHIYFGDKVDRKGTGGNLDVDIRYPIKSQPAVENITWPNKSRMVAGTYKFYVNCWANRVGRSGFRAEIEFDGKIYSYNFTRPLRTGEDVAVAHVTLNSNGEFSIEHKMDSSESSREIWGVKTEQFVPVSVAMFSPNYWDLQQGIGHRHYFFMLKGCVNSDQPNGFYNEFLRQDLDKHRKVLEALGSYSRVEPDSDQLSGVGFSSTKRAELVVKVKGQTERLLKIVF